MKLLLILFVLIGCAKEGTEFVGDTPTKPPPEENPCSSYYTIFQIQDALASCSRAPIQVRDNCIYGKLFEKEGDDEGT